MQILAKAEMLNPGGSVKDRVALQIVQEALAEGRLKPGGLITEGTAGERRRFRVGATPLLCAQQVHFHCPAGHSQAGPQSAVCRREPALPNCQDRVHSWFLAQL